jgi:lipoprotein-releasing system permease protein
MNFPLFIARRYFLSKRKKNFINIISTLSMVGVAFSTAALIIVLSVFNGLEGLLRSLYSSFDPELKIEATEGKSFEISAGLLNKVKSVEGVETVTEVIEDYAYVRYRDADMVAILRGVSDNFVDQHRLDNHIVQGEMVLKKDSVPFAIIGSGVRNTLSVAVDDNMFALQIFYIKSAKTNSIDPSSLYSRKSIRAGGVFSIEKNYDENYIFLPLSFTQELLNYGNKRTSLEIKVSSGVNLMKVKNQLSAKLGSAFKLLTNEEQHKDLYRLLKMEKLVVFLSLSILILIGSINIFFSLMMLAIDKKKDVTVLAALGANQNLIRRIFLTEGALISFGGATTGLLLGAIICYLQDRFGLVGMGMENAIVSSYPVKLRAMDFVYTASMITVVTFIVSNYPAHKASRFYSTEYL